MAAPRILLLTCVPPSDVGIGGIYLRELCKWYPHDSICCFHVDRLPNGTPSPALAWLPMRYVPAPPERDWPSDRHRARRLLRSGIERYRELTAIPRLVEQAVAFGNQQRVELVWATLHSPTGVRLAKPVADRLNAPLVTTVWDPPEYVARGYGLDRFTLRRLLRVFDNTVSASRRCAVASKPMQSLYERKYGIPCVPMTYTPPNYAAAPDQKSASEGAFTIGYAGSLYAYDAWDALLQALVTANWRLAGRSVVIRLFGDSFHLRASAPARIEYWGWHSVEETVRLLSQMDICYVPYWFSERLSLAAQLSFPSKLATYIAAGVPSFFHGPPDSSVTSFFSRHPVGVTCHSLSPGVIIQALEPYARDPAASQRARAACRTAYQEELSPPVFRRQFAKLIGVGENDLLPM